MEHHQDLGTDLEEPFLSRCDNLVEQREHRSTASAVVDVHECGGAVMRAQSLVAKLVSRIVVMGELGKPPRSLRLDRTASLRGLMLAIRQRHSRPEQDGDGTNAARRQSSRERVRQSGL
jgi:hypothetical protein